MSPSTLQRYIHENIPMSRLMQSRVSAVEPDAVTLTAPLEPNINHRDTVFGGSASALAILAAWSLLHTRLLREGFATRLVIQRNTMEYLRPITGEFSARARCSDGAEWQRFIQTLDRRGKARIRVISSVRCEGAEVGRLTGDFVAWTESSP